MKLDIRTDRPPRGSPDPPVAVGRHGVGLTTCEGQSPDVLRYWYPPEGGGIGSDNMVVPKGARNPVLAHHFINFMLDSTHAFDNSTT
jgi:spermidine/putrescine-binding protein